MIASTTLVLAALSSPPAGAAAKHPNIVVMYADNLGYGEVGSYGGVRGVPTPRLDALARQGMRLTNFNVETFCTPSRTALLTGRYGIRSGTLLYRPPVTGMTMWEVTLAELVKPLGYATAMYGKWHVGDAAGRAPTHQGFDEASRTPATRRRRARSRGRRRSGRAARAGRRARSSRSTSRRGRRSTAR
jgi:arylsulfatase A-like enzyme